ncbi:MAG: redoxin domain-containing protein [Xanthomonadales bacterium]|nr:redoxin domain-containing protein [Xanthomonadales bacterium]
MNLKRYFVPTWLIYSSAVLLYAILRIASSATPALSWWGLALAAAAPLIFFAWIMLSRPARTSPHPVAVSVASGLGLGICMAGAYRYGASAGSVHVWAGLAVIGWFVYLKWYSGYGPEPDAVQTGKPLPEFELLDENDQPVHSQEFIGTPTVLIFIRGNWCPFCTAQVRETAASYRKIEQLGAQVTLISNQDKEKMEALARKFDAPLRFMRDPGLHAAVALGIIDAGGTVAGLGWLGYEADAIRPAVIVTDAAGIVRYSSVTSNYRIRPEPEEFIQVLESL